MPKPIRRSDRQNRDYLRRFFASRRGQDILREEDVPVGDINLLPEAPVYGTPTQYEERDLSADVLRGGALAAREIGGLAPFLGEALDVAELNEIMKTGKDFYGDEADPTVYAGVTAGGLFLPNLIERPAKFVGRMGKKFFKFGGDKLSKKGTPFKSEIDWGKWNPETPKYPELIKEYNDIERRTKLSGTWMKNADGTDFDGPPELFIQTQSKAFKEAFPEGYDKLYRGLKTRKSDRAYPEPKAGNPTFYSEDAAQASQYTGESPKSGSSFSPGEVDPRRYTPTNMEDLEGGLFELAYPSEKNKIAINVAGSNWQRTEKFGPEAIKPQKEYIETLRQRLSDPSIQKSHTEWQIERAKTQLRFMESPRSVSSDREVNAFYDRYFEWANKKGLINPNSPSTDNFAAFLKDNPDVNRIILRGVDDEWIGDVNILSNKSGVFPKSLIGNRGTFDLSDPNVFKALLPIVGGAAAFRASRSQGDTQGEEMSQGGMISMKKKPTGMSAIRK